MYSRPPLPLKKNPVETKWVLDKGPQAVVDYEKYGHPIAQPGPVISSKTGKPRASHSQTVRQTLPAI